MSELPEARTQHGLRARRRRLSLKPVNRLILGANRPIGSDAGIGQGMEMALTVVVFLGLGWLIDSWAGTRPIFTIALVVFAMVGESVRMWIAYDARMRRLEDERRQRSASSARSGSESPEVGAP